MSLKEIREEGVDIVRKLRMYELAYGKDEESPEGIEGGAPYA